ncbi:hypothetical protein FCV87_12090 [Vibrio breoganii]|uniref:Flp family type IVb pilin n=1 Tax=Vibrio breoganii TaxID=553239 RepID=UPI000C847B05|nr:hypothetical protein [Vibrio breoganii]PMK32517.1 hypothetical protein BCU03_04755 [Vibrio breoganii]TKG27183.1 hypothetical protein FCV87_12090 [Vibrio breoganii]
MFKVYFSLLKVVAFFRDDEGLTVVEYVVGAALLVAALSTVFLLFSAGLSDSMTSTMDRLPVVISD